MSLQHGSPQPAPRQNFLMRRLPMVRATVFFSLPPAEAWGRLLGPDSKQWRVKQDFGSWIYQYNLHPHADGLTLDIDGPYGPRAGAIRCRVRLIAAGSATTLELESRHKGNPYWGLLIPLIVIFTLMSQGPLWWILLCLAMLISIWYTAITISLHIDADKIQSHIIVLLNDNRPGVLF